MRIETWKNGLRVSVSDDGQPAPAPRGVALDALAVDAEKASTVAALRDVVKKVIDLERARP